MENSTIYENGAVFINGIKLTNLSSVPWVKHPQFKGVYTKTVIAESDCDNYLKAMVVKIDPHCGLGNHLHKGMAELHEVISGEGKATIGTNAVAYAPGVISFIPADTNHSVEASSSGLIMWAKFTNR